MDLVRQARKATSAMEAPEPSRGVYVGVFLVAIGLLSYLSTDVIQETVKLHGKTTTVTEHRHPSAHGPHPHHPRLGRRPSRSIGAAVT